MDVRIALVPVDQNYWLDRQISNLRGGQLYSHGAILVYLDDSQVMWYDVHWRWFSSDFREIPAKNYSWTYHVFEVADCTPAKALLVHSWIQEQRTRWVNYDLFGALLMPFHKLRVDSPRSFTCFEFITRALMKAGYLMEYDPEKALASDLLQSGFLLPERR